VVKRKPPVRHTVRAHKRKGKSVRSYLRGSGTQSQRPSKAVGRVYTPTVTSVDVTTDGPYIDHVIVNYEMDVNGEVTKFDLYSTDGGETWETEEPVPASIVRKLSRQLTKIADVAAREITEEMGPIRFGDFEDVDDRGEVLASKLEWYIRHPPARLSI